MKSVPRVDMDGNYMTDVVVSDSFQGIMMAFDWNKVTDGAGNPAGVQIGYDVAIPMRKSFFKPRFDIQAYQAESYTDPSDLWLEMMSTEEIKGITKPPQQGTIEQRLDQIVEQQSQMWEFILGG